MTRETKFGLLIGTVIILLIGLVVSDYLSVQPADRQASDPSALSSPLLLDSSAPGTSAPQAIGGGAGLGSGNNMATFPPATPGDANLPSLPGPTAPTNTMTLPSPTAPADSPVAMGNGFGQPPLAYRTGTTALPLASGSAVSEPASLDGSSEPIGLFDQPQPVGQPQPMVAAGTPVPPMEIAEPPALPTTSGTTLTHMVKASETLWTIARIYYRDGSQWTKIAQANKAKLGAKNQLKIGMTLEIPDVAASVTSTAQTPTQSTSTVRTITVAKGDTLEKLAQRYLGSKAKADELFQANRDKLKKPEQLQIGMVLKLPESANAGQPQAAESDAKPKPQADSRNESARAPGSTYVVQKGDTLYTIAKKTLGNGERWRDIRDANKDQFGGKETPTLKIGMKLAIPAKGSSAGDAARAETRSTSASVPNGSPSDLFSSASPTQVPPASGDPVMGHAGDMAPMPALLLTDEPVTQTPAAKPRARH